MGTKNARRRRSRSLPSSKTKSGNVSDDASDEEYDSPPSPQMSSQRKIPSTASPASRRRWTVDIDVDDVSGNGKIYQQSSRIQSLRRNDEEEDALMSRSPSSKALPDWLFEVDDDINNDSLLVELGIHPKRFFKKIIWVLVWTWLPRGGQKWENKLSSFSTLGATLDPSILASSEDFWGSFLMVILYATSHYNRGQFRFNISLFTFVIYF